MTLPNRTAEAGESDVEAADRELKEEVGLETGRIELLGELTLAPGHLCHTITVLLAEELYEQSLPGDEPEDLEVVPVPLADANRLIQTGTINQARVIAAICSAKGALALRKAPAGTGSAAASDTANARLGSVCIRRNERPGV